MTKKLILSGLAILALSRCYQSKKEDSVRLAECAILTDFLSNEGLSLSRNGKVSYLEALELCGKYIAVFNSLGCIYQKGKGIRQYYEDIRLCADAPDIKKKISSYE